MNKLFIISLIFLTPLVADAQEPIRELISSSGNSHHNHSYYLDWSVGEVAIQTLEGTSGTLSQGFHQGILEIKPLSDNSEHDVNIAVYPNPTSSIIKLATDENFDNELIIYITTLTGSKIYQGFARDNNWQFNFRNYASGTYIIQIIKNNQKIKTFKIIKK
jgi:hypothetical protein